MERELRDRVDPEVSKWAARLVAVLHGAGVEAGFRLARTANTRQARTAKMKVIRRAVTEGELAAGVRPDGRKRWAVDCVLKWERGEADDGWWALVKWLGFDRVSGEPWEDSWVKESWLTQDLRRKRKLVGGRIGGEDSGLCVRQRLAAGWRVSPRMVAQAEEAEERRLDG